MAWTTPKTNWQATDRFNITDFNRIKNNLLYFLQDDTYVKYSETVTPIADMTSYEPIYNVDDFNTIETWLDMIASAYGQDFGLRKTFYANGVFIDFNELNRIEKASSTLKDSTKTGSLLLGYLIYTETSSTQYTVTGIKVNEVVKDKVETLIIPTNLGDIDIAF